MPHKPKGIGHSPRVRFTNDHSCEVNIVPNLLGTIVEPLETTAQFIGRYVIPVVSEFGSRLRDNVETVDKSLRVAGAASTMVLNSLMRR